jgi:sugar lactone lactonase YvrE
VCPSSASISSERVSDQLEAGAHKCLILGADEFLTRHRPDISDPVGVFIDEREAVWVISATLNRILKYNREGELQYYFGAYGGTRGGFPGGLSRPHQIDVDQEGNLYVASWDGGWVNKFVPKPGADPTKLVGRPLVLVN